MGQMTQLLGGIGLSPTGTEAPSEAPSAALSEDPWNSVVISEAPIAAELQDDDDYYDDDYGYGEDFFLNEDYETDIIKHGNSNKYQIKSLSGPYHLEVKDRHSGYPL